LRRPKGLKALPVVPVYAVFRAYPDETNLILVNLPHCQVAETFRVPERTKAVFLGKQHPGRQQQKDAYPDLNLADHSEVIGILAWAR
jgi:hypothetical protein